jgi:hypothetical protein
MLSQVNRGTTTTYQQTYVLTAQPLGGDMFMLLSVTGDPLDLGGGVMLPKTQQALVAMRAGPDGTPRWATVLQGSAGTLPVNNFSPDTTIDGMGNVWIEVFPMGTLTVDGTALPYTTFMPVFLKLDPSTGKLVTSLQISGGSHCTYLGTNENKYTISPQSTVVGTDDGIVFGGAATGQCDFGGGPLPPMLAAGEFGFAVRLAGDGSFVWSTLLASLDALAIGRSGDAIYAAGVPALSGPFVIGGTTLNGNVGLVRLDLATGSVVFAKALSGLQRGQTTVLAVAASPGGVAIAGETLAGETFGITDPGPGSGAYLYKIDSSGNPLFLRTFAGTFPGAYAWGPVAALAPTGQEGVALFLHGSMVDYGAGPLQDSASKLSAALFQLP